MEILKAYSSLFKKNKCIYTSSYCEENIYFLCDYFAKLKNQCKDDESLQKSKAFAVFITNWEKKTWIKYQKIGNPLNQNLVIWDYHVIFIHKIGKDSYVYDFDSILDFPLKFNEYFEKALKFEIKGKKQTYYRICEYDGFLSEFASDRSHMLVDKVKEIYLSLPPDYPCIKNELGELMNLPKYLDLNEKDKKYGLILDENLFYKFFNN